MVDYSQLADAGRGKIERDRRAEAAGTDAQYARCANFPLAFETDLGQDHMPGIAAKLIGG